MNRLSLEKVQQQTIMRLVSLGNFLNTAESDITTLQELDQQ